jgi:hypothetical protein
MKTTSNGRQTQTKCGILELLDHTQILNWNLDDQTIYKDKGLWPPMEGTSNGRQPPMEEGLKSLKWNISATTYDKVYGNLLSWSSKWPIFKTDFDDKLISDFDLYMLKDNWNILCFTKFCF